MNAVSQEQTERIWLNAYLPGVPTDIEAGIEDYPSLREVFLEHLHKYRDRVAYVSIGTEMTYAAWQAQGIAFAAWLQAQGVRKGDRVALMMPNCLQYPICLLGTILAGAVVVNVNPLYTSHELKHLLKDSGAETVVIFENFAHTLEKVVAGSTVKRVVIAAIGDLLGTFKGAAMNFILRRVQKQVPAFNLPGAVRFNTALKQGRGLTHTPVPLAREELAFLQYTGGTTGDAKGVMLSHRNIIANLLQAKAWVGDQLDQNQQETNVTLLPLYHIFSLTVNCLMFMCLGGRNILIANPRDVKRVQMILRKERFNGIAGVNTLFNGLLENAEFRARDFSDLRLVIAGGMATHTAVAKRWKEVTGLPIIEGYGLTECSPVVSISPIDISRMRDMEFTGSIGVPLPSTWVRFIREDGALADIGEQGELQVRGPQVMQGYWQRPKETAEVLDAEGWLSTGDIGVMNAQGFIRLVDRKKDMILVSGFNVYPNEIEDVVALHPGVAEVAAIGVEDGVTGEKVKIVVVRRDPNLTQEQLLAHCREYLTGYKVPKFVEFRTEELPKTTVGKVLRRALR
ncbi:MULTISPECIES: AMP-binding protein [Pseudomonas]|uniref:Long-chain-fatty-acid--CoA ligase n=1 Tax=Pseudomonas proteolytica TaxID=219574 RepID=A0AAW5AKD7_9PSED|nr:MULTISPECIES: AMP-binding protein [Pseudomonas]KAA8695522.1 AMP-binding protein [Pseudomonas proteolytica]MBC3336524.1 AMP-binding protein [Pseudomonas proteolytica]MCF5060213.1 AMP-binding protein [Pseudomonas proteolytica]MCF5104468.1 AMP-binding protein [Pseudomonas proteolytica]NMZ08816.1 AMP-binding protein [Pseudomonas proteolytica]